MGPLGYLSIGFAPGILWLWLIIRRSQHRPEPRSLLLRTFLLGVAVALPIVFAESLVQGTGGASDTSMSPADAAFMAFLVAGLCEELGKFWVVQASLKDSPYLDDPLRGMIFSSAVALGFSSIENVKYMLVHGPEVIFVRAILCTLGHVGFSAFWGAALGWTRQQASSNRSILSLGILGAIASHGLYDYFLFVGDPLSSLITFAVVTGLFFVVLNRARAASQSIHASSVALLPCRQCTKLVPAGAPFCPSCGHRVVAQSTKYCGQCKTDLPLHTEFCSGCGAKLVEHDS